jgi:hypothetical protein
MTDQSVKKGIMAVMLGILLFGGAAALIGVYHSAKDIELSLTDAADNYDGDIFI